MSWHCPSPRTQPVPLPLCPPARPLQLVTVCKHVLYTSGLEGWQLGRTRVFLRTGQLAQLEVGEGRQKGRGLAGASKLRWAPAGSAVQCPPASPHPEGAASCSELLYSQPSILH